MNESTQKLMFSSATDDWATPQWLFDALDREFHFSLDVCASEKNHKCAVYYSREQNGLAHDWFGVAWMNPPYGEEIGEWMRKAWLESQKGVTVVCLVPARTDTVWWHDYAMRSREVRFLKGRVKFGDSGDPAPFPSALVIFRPSDMTPVFKSVRMQEELPMPLFEATP